MSMLVPIMPAAIMAVITMPFLLAKAATIVQ
jgi:hypothetical protein